MADNLTLQIRSERYDTGKEATKPQRHKEINHKRSHIGSKNQQPKKLSIFKNFLTSHLTYCQRHLYFEQLFCSIGNDDTDRHIRYYTSVIRQLAISQKQQNIMVRKAPRHPAFSLRHTSM